MACQPLNLVKNFTTNYGTRQITHTGAGRSERKNVAGVSQADDRSSRTGVQRPVRENPAATDRKSTRLNSSHANISTFPHLTFFRCGTLKVSKKTLQAFRKPMIGHRGQGLKDLYAKIQPQ